MHLAFKAVSAFHRDRQKEMGGRDYPVSFISILDIRWAQGVTDHPWIRLILTGVFIYQGARAYGGAVNVFWFTYPDDH